LLLASGRPSIVAAAATTLSTRKEVKVAEHPNVLHVTRALEARARGKFDAKDTKIILDAFADDAVWHMSGAWSDVQGKDALLAQWKAVAEASDDSFRVELHEMFADDDHAIGISTIRAKNGEKTMEMKEIQVFHLDAAGKITEFWGIVADEEELNAFWAPAGGWNGDADGS
jgi:ketosteroid isomerase-like protein